MGLLISGVFGFGLSILFADRFLKILTVAEREVIKTPRDRRVHIRRVGFRWRRIVITSILAFKEPRSCGGRKIIVPL